MKIITKFAVASLLALSAVVPAFAAESESQTLADRNRYVYGADARPVALRVQRTPRAYRATEAMAYAPAAFNEAVDFGISSQR